MKSMLIRTGTTCCFIAICASLLAACGVTIKATKVAQSEFSKKLKRPGVYYALPKSQIDINIPVTLEVTSSGNFGFDFEACVKACTNDKVASAGVCKTDKKVRLLLGKPEVISKSVPDYDQIYVVTAEGGPLSGIAHAMSLTEGGILTDATSTATNTGLDFAIGITKELAKMSILADAGNPNICDEAAQVADKFLSIEKQIKDREENRDSLLKLPLPSEPKNTDMIKLALDHLLIRVQEAKANRTALIEKNKIEPEKKTFKFKYTLENPIEPRDFQSVMDQNVKLRAGPFSDDGTLLPKDVTQIIDDQMLSWFVSIEAMKFGCDSNASSPNCVASTELDGYHYRVPVPGKLVVRCHGNGDLCATTGTVVGKGNVPVAQYGPIASLPSKFKGKGGKVQLSLNPLTGGLSKVEIGSEAVASATVTGPLETLSTSYQDRRKRKDQEEKDALDAEKNDLTRERDILKLRKEIGELQN